MDAGTLPTHLQNPTHPSDFQTAGLPRLLGPAPWPSPRARTAAWDSMPSAPKPLPQSPWGRGFLSSQHLAVRATAPTGTYTSNGKAQKGVSLTPSRAGRGRRWSSRPPKSPSTKQPLFAPSPPTTAGDPRGPLRAGQPPPRLALVGASGCAAQERTTRRAAVGPPVPASHSVQPADPRTRQARAPLPARGLPLPALPAARALTWPGPRGARRGLGIPRDARPTHEPRATSHEGAGQRHPASGARDGTRGRINGLPGRTGSAPSEVGSPAS